MLMCFYSSHVSVGKPINVETTKKLRVLLIICANVSRKNWSMASDVSIVNVCTTRIPNPSMYTVVNV